MELYKLTATQAIDAVVEEVMEEHPELSKAKESGLQCAGLLVRDK